MEIKHEHVFGGGMNLDLAPEALPKGVSRHIYNARYDEFVGQMKGRLSGIRGTVEYEIEVGDELPGGVNKVVGSAKDYKNMSVILFIWNEESYHSIYSANLLTKKVTKVLQYGDVPSRWKFFMYFNENEKITHANVVGDMLYWVSETFPRKINLVKAKLFSHGDYINGYSEITVDVLSAVKPPPLLPPTAKYLTVSSLRSNLLRGRTFSFRYSYVFDDNELSTTSPVSAPCIPVGDYDSDGSNIDSSVNNAINVVIKTGPECVKKINVYVRDGDVGQWVLLKSIEKNQYIQSYQSYTLLFTGSEGVSPADQDYVERPFSNLPINAKTQEFVDEKYILYGQILSGFDYVSPSASVSRRFFKINLEGGGSDFSIPNTEVYAPQFGYSYHIDFGAPLVHVVGNVISGTVQYIAPDPNPNNYQSFLFSFTVDVLSLDVNVIRSDFNRAVNAVGAPYGIKAGSVTGDGISYIKNEDFPFNQLIVVINEIATPSLGIMSSFKLGSRTGIYMRYHDYAGRYGSTIRLGSVASEWHNDFFGDEVDDDSYAYGIKAEVSISHQPPEYAVGYQILITRPEDLSSYSQMLVFFSRDYGYNNKYSTVDISMFQDIPVKNRQSNLSGYVYNPGDRLRFISIAEDIASIGSRVNAYYDVEVLGYGKKTVDTIEVDDVNVLKISKVLIPDGASTLFEGYAIVEIYTPRAFSDEDASYEIGLTLPILNAGTLARAHGGNVADQVIGDTPSPAVVSVYPGNSLWHYRRFENTLTLSGGFFYVEDVSYSDYSLARGTLGLGRLGVFSLLIRRLWLNALQYSEAYIEDSNTNGLSMFHLVGRFKNLQNTGGDISALVYAGYVLTVIQEKDNQSIYVGRSGLEQASSDGVEVVVSSDKVLSTSYPSFGRYGCVHPESVIVVNRNVYFYDYVKACIVRRAPNGLSSVSDEYGVTSEIQSITNTIRASSGRSYVYSSYNQKYDELYFTFIVVDGGVAVLNKTIVFGERANQFKFFIEHSNENGDCISGYNYIGDVMLSFMNSAVFQHDASDKRNLFYGSLKPKRVKVVVNPVVQKEKTFDAIAVFSNAKWESPSFDNISTGPVDGYPLGMKTMLLASDFEYINGAYYSNIKMNAILGSMPPSLLNMINGEPMRGNYLELEIVNMSSDDVWMSEIIVYCRVSELSG